MRKNEFLRALRRALRRLQPSERQRYVADYAELIDDKLESGMSEENAVAGLGDVNAIASALEDQAREQGRLKPRRSAAATALIVIGSPVWASLAAAGAAIIVAVYAAIWAVMVALCAAEAALALTAPLAAVYAALYAAQQTPLCLCLLGAGLLLAAAAVALWHPLTRLIAGTVHFTARAIQNGRARLTGKGRTKP